MREVLGSNLIEDIAFFGGKTCSTVTKLTIVTRRWVLVEQELFTSLGTSGAGIVYFHGY
jgi:hypothetical protein